MTFFWHLKKNLILKILPFVCSTFWSFYLLIVLPFVVLPYDRSTFCHSTFCNSNFCLFYLFIVLPFVVLPYDRSTFCHSTFCNSTFCNSTFCNSTFCTGAGLNTFHYLIHNINIRLYMMVNFTFLTVSNRDLNFF